MKSKAYLSMSSYFLVQPELEMNYCDFSCKREQNRAGSNSAERSRESRQQFFLIGDKTKYDEINHSFILELKYNKPTATDDELAAQAEEGKALLHRYAQDKVAQRLVAPTTMHLILLQFKGSELVKCEEI